MKTSTAVTISVMRQLDAACRDLLRESHEVHNCNIILSLALALTIMLTLMKVMLAFSIT